MALIGVQNLSISFGGPALLDGIQFFLEAGDRVCLLGRNGTGKSTLLRAIAGEVTPDGGNLTTSGPVSVAYLSQELPKELHGSALEIASDRASEHELAAERCLTMLDVDARAAVDTMSGGEKRRVLLARVLATEADVLLLDEPTNHLDIDTVMRLEEYLLRRVKSFVFVTHDRAFARAVSNRIAEIDRGALYTFQVGYDRFLERREELLDAEQKRAALFDKRLAEEEIWLRRGVKARRTRNEGRVKALVAMREVYRSRRERTGNARLEISRADRTGNLVFECTGVAFGYEESHPLVDDFTATVLRGDRIGVVGPNGSGKTTLLKLLLGELAPIGGTIRRGVNLQPLYLDQLRAELNPDLTVAENVAHGQDFVELNGRRKHIIGYLRDFLFGTDRVHSPVSQLSGGERNRLLLARLFAQPSNLLVLDEPTNDLDVETLELFEELLQQYTGTILLVSHDRVFLDNVVSGCYVLAGGGRVVEYVGGYSDWNESEYRRRTMEEIAAADARKRGAVASDAKAARTRKPAKARTLTFREQKELDNLPDRIHDLETETARIHEELADPEFYRSPANRATPPDTDRVPPDPAAATRRLEELEQEITRAYDRWQELDAIGEK